MDPDPHPCREKLSPSFWKVRFLALKWAVCEQFRDYLYYALSFTLYTVSNRKLFYQQRNIVRWDTQRYQVDFSFEIKYRPGKVNNDDDTWSRLPLDISHHIPS